MTKSYFDECSSANVQTKDTRAQMSPRCRNNNNNNDVKQAPESVTRHRGGCAKVGASPTHPRKTSDEDSFF